MQEPHCTHSACLQPAACGCGGHRAEPSRAKQRHIHAGLRMIRRHRARWSALRCCRRQGYGSVHPGPRARLGHALTVGRPGSPSATAGLRSARDTAPRHPNQHLATATTPARAVPGSSQAVPNTLAVRCRARGRWRRYGTPHLTSSADSLTAGCVAGAATVVLQLPLERRDS